MKDETFVFISDVKDKKITARSARHTRTHCGKGGRVRLPSDNLSKKELMKMSGECKSYKLNSPMTYKEFKSMPDDIKVTYIKLLQQKFNVPFNHIGKMLGCAQRTISAEIVRLGLSKGKGVEGRSTKWDKEGFYAWANGVDLVPAPVPEEIPAEAPAIEEVTQEDLHEIERMMTGVKNQKIMPETYVEDDLPFEEPDAVMAEQDIALQDKINALQELIDNLYESNEELKAVHEKDKAEIAHWKKACEDLNVTVRIREAQLEVVQLIFGGKNRD